MITIIDYGMGNLGSLLNMFKKIDVVAEIISEPEKILTGERTVYSSFPCFPVCG